jgi:hypothetical protein
MPERAVYGIDIFSINTLAYQARYLPGPPGFMRQLELSSRDFYIAVLPPYFARQDIS